MYERKETGVLARINTETEGRVFHMVGSSGGSNLPGIVGSREIEPDL